jgi:hypothetical protein
MFGRSRERFTTAEREEMGRRTYNRGEWGSVVNKVKVLREQ